MANIYGTLPVLEALKAGGRRIERVIIAEGARDWRLQEIVDAAKGAGVPLRREPRITLDRLVGHSKHQGVVALASAAGYVDEEDLLAKLAHDAFLIVLDGVEDPRNLGAIVRTAECAGVQAVVVPKRRAAHLSETVAKTSAGAVEHIPVARVTNIVSFIEHLKKRGIWVVGVERTGRMIYSEFDFTVPVALVLGGEGQGLHRLVRERCDALVSIPMRGRIDSLNVSVAAGVLMFEVVRQRQPK